MRLRQPSRPLLTGLLVAGLALGAAACGDDDDPSASGDDGTTTSEATTTGGSDGGPGYGTTTDGDPEAEGGTIVAVDFELSDITVAPGAEIILRNDGEQVHTATADDGEFDLGEVDPGAESEPGTAPEEPGSYTFHCEIHDSMTATLTVEG